MNMGYKICIIAMLIVALISIIGTNYVVTHSEHKSTKSYKRKRKLVLLGVVDKMLKCQELAGHVLSYDDQNPYFRPDVLLESLMDNSDLWYPPDVCCDDASFIQTRNEISLFAYSLRTYATECAYVFAKDEPFEDYFRKYADLLETIVYNYRPCYLTIAAEDVTKSNPVVEKSRDEVISVYKELCKISNKIPEDYFLP